MSQRLDMLDKLIAKGSQDPFVHYARAMELRSLTRAAEALQAFHDLRGRFPTYVPTYLMAGQLAVELSQLDVARQFMEQGLERARAAGDGHAESELASALASLG
ncbi:MAG TPA: tetratricopeptide repeat protein [Polyangiales bacterium]|jgi:predicted Zn-dependent protease|nr:tetratricopeptide repeat protein [Polyangiales bacterium]